MIHPLGAGQKSLKIINGFYLIDIVQAGFRFWYMKKSYDSIHPPSRSNRLGGLYFNYLLVAFNPRRMTGILTGK